MNGQPFILAETGGFAVVYKPPRMHCAAGASAGTLLDWYAARFPGFLAVAGRRRTEGGIMHRLDFETQGLVLFAKTQTAFDFFLAGQDEGRFVKEYSAACLTASPFRPEGFPPPPEFARHNSCFFPPAPFYIESFFRPFGPGRKQVRPVTEMRARGRETASDRGAPYRTEVAAVSGNSLTLRLRRGFRHQIRCHLAWLQRPVLNDPLYGQAAETGAGFLALRAHALFFDDPETGAAREYRIAPLEAPA